MANIIKIKRGLSSNISNATLEQGELAITTDTNELYVGTESGNTKLNEKFSVVELPISSDGKVDLTQIITDATPGKLYKVIDPNSKTTGDLYFGTHAITFGASRTFAQGSNAFVQPGTILLSTGQYGFIYVFPMATTAIYQLDINIKDNHYQAWVYDVTENYTYDKTYHIMPQSEITTPAGTTAFTQDSSARTFTAVGAEGVTYKNEITLSDSVSNILISSLGSLIEDVGPADQNAKIDITDTSGVVSNILDKKGRSEDLINTGPLASGSKITLTYVSGSYKPTNAQQIFTLEYYAKETTDSELTSFVSSLIDLESTARRQADRSLQKNIDTETFNLQTQIFNLQENAMPIEQDSVTYQVENNFEYRFFGPSNSGVTHLGISFENVSLTSGDKFKTSVIFQTTSSGCTFEITESASVKVKLTGDDVTNGVLNPVASKVYEIAFYWNGFFMSGVVRGVNFAAPMNKITISNGNFVYGSNYTNDVEVYQDYDSSTGVFSNLLATISNNETSEIFTPKNEIYPRIVANGSEANYLDTSSLINCTDLGELELGSTTTKQGLRIRIDSSPASVELSPVRSNGPIK